MKIIMYFAGAFFLSFILTCEFPVGLSKANAQEAQSEFLSQYQRRKALANANTIGLITGSTSESDIRIGTDLTDILNSDDLRVLPIIGHGALKNINDILYLKGIDIGIVQTDTLEYMKDISEKRDIKKRLRYITKLYYQEVHVLARKEISSLVELKGKKVNFGTKESGSYITASTVFSRLSINVDVQTFNQREALEKLKRNEISAIVQVVGKPSNLLKTISQSDKKKLHILPIPYNFQLQRVYLPSLITHQHYPDLVPAGKAIPTIAASTVMAVYNWPEETERYKKVAHFTREFFDKLKRFSASSRHPKWKETFLDAEVPGWERFKAAEELLAERAVTKNVLGRISPDNTENLDKIKETFKAFLSQQEVNGKRLSGKQKELLFQAFLKWRRSSPEAKEPPALKAARKWILNEFQPSTLSREQQIEEMKWFIKASEPFRGMEIHVLSERIPTHEYESKVLTKAFEEITGIKVNHQLLNEGDVIQTVQTQMQTKRSLFDAYINDSDLIGTHFRLQLVENLTDWMNGAGKAVTLPTLDINDFMGKEFTTGPNGKLYQLPDQQFANLYWFRYDWFQRPELKKKFRKICGYDLGVPVNWSAYEDIAQFFTVHVKEIDGVRVYGHMDYGKRAPDLGWRMTDAWLSMAGAGSKGLPNGYPIDEWGIRMKKGTCNPVGASVSRGGATNGPAAVYAIRKWDEWLRKYAPPGAAGYDFYQSLPSLSQGNVAQQIFWYTAFTAAMVSPKLHGNETVDDNGKPLWKMAPSPHGAYWRKGQKLGYQDAGSWTLFKSTPLKRRQAAWLYAQFVVSKTVDVKKSHVGLTFIRDSTVRHDSFTKRSPDLGGLIEFYRSPDRVNWTPTGVNVPNYPQLAPLWWQNIGEVNSGAFTPQQALNRLAQQMDQAMSNMEAADKKSRAYGGCGPRLNKKMPLSAWLGREGAKAKLKNEKPQGKTIQYEELIQRWTNR